MLPIRRALSTLVSSYAARPLISVDLNRAPTEQQIPLHNRWHPDVPSVVSVRRGDVFRVECVDWTGGQIGNNDSADDVKNVDLTRIHYLSGPIEVEGSRPGDILVVDILDVGPLPASMWGFTGIFDHSNGGGFLTDLYPQARKAIWDFSGIYATSRHIRDVRFAGLTHPGKKGRAKLFKKVSSFLRIWIGLIGCAPSHELLATWNKRELELIKTCHHAPIVAQPPNKQGALLGRLSASENKAKWEQVASEGARTIPPREHGGNCDIKNISRGSRVYFPVYVDGAKLSLGDIHFSQGDGEISFCGAIEMVWYSLPTLLSKNRSFSHSDF
jgi:formamidase